MINEKNEDELYEIFIKNKITFEKYSQDPYKFLNDPNLIVKVNDVIYQWKLAAPLIISLYAF